MSEERKHHPLAGATGQFPRGKQRPDDEGELGVVCTADKAANLVRLDFGKPVAWLSVNPDECRGIALTLLRMASKLDGKILTVQIGSAPAEAV